MHIRSMRINKIRNLKPFTFSLGNEDIRHLLITGKNGSGKTTLITAIQYHFAVGFGQFRNQMKDAISADLTNSSTNLEISSELKDLELLMDVEGELEQDTFIIFFEANRKSTPDRPGGTNKLNFDHLGVIGPPQMNQYFVQFLVNRWTDKAYALVENKLDEVKEIDTWFENLTGHLRSIFEDESLELEYIRKDYNFRISSQHKAPYSFHDLSAGQSAAISIVTELLVRLETIKSNIGKKGTGIVIIDEIETHLHVSLQKKILPFLIDLFPTIQFIVTTHSPFVLISSSKTCILDMDRLKVFEDFSRFSYEAIVEDYFEVDQYSSSLKASIVTAVELIQDKALGEAKELLQKISAEHEAKLRTSAELSFKINELLIKIREESNDPY